jgi:single-strand DNA-binding protein
MPALNRIQLIGYLGKDPEVRYTPTGRKYCLFTLAVNRYWKDSDGERKDATDWFNIEARGRVEEICEQYLRKGRLVFLEGSVHTNRYEHEGETRYYTKVVTYQVQMLDRCPQDEEAPVEEEEELILD